MASKLVWLRADGTPNCGHSRALGQPGPGPGEWYCSLCAAHVTAALDQALAEVTEEQAQRRGEAQE